MRIFHQNFLFYFIEMMSMKLVHCNIKIVRVHRVLPKDRTPRIAASHKQITDQYTNVCHVVKTLERETVHAPGQIATRSNLLCKRKKVT